MTKLLKQIKAIDKYGFGVFTGLKIMFIMLGLIGFAYFMHLQEFAMFIVVVLAIIAIIELPQVNSPLKKDLLYLFIATMVSTLYIVFSISTVMPMVIGVVMLLMLIFGLLYRFQVNQFYFVLICNCVLLVVFCLAVFTPNSNTVILNDVIALVEFVTLGFWLHKFYPNRYYNRWVANYIYAVQNLVDALRSNDSTRLLTLRKIFKDLQNNVFLLGSNIDCFKLADQLNKTLMNYSFFIINELVNRNDDLNESLALDVEQINLAIKSREQISLKYSNDDIFHQNSLNEITLNWNKLCKQMF